MSYRGGRGGGRGGGGGGGKKPYTVSTKLYIGNIPETCRRMDLQKLFENYGKVVECDIVKNYGFVHYENEDEAKQATAELNNTEFEGSILSVELSHSRVRHKPGMGGKQECYRCGKEGHWSKDCPKGPSRPKGYSDRGPDPYDYYRDRYPPPPPPDRFRPYPDPYDRRPPLPRDPYAAYPRERDPYARPPPEYYGRRDPYAAYDRRSADPYLDDYYRRSSASYLPPPPGTRLSPTPRARVAPY
ncbi:RNA-binding protein lark-like isoform X1 [Ruditapes philippinarum]|uniref:RNA-binding protein lark-like isoform X1 n=1 Tax=Ruditapes philippinarum TaxID=129788 RepID=UPI00295AA88F|nr:RNA-binding protein lark-like isoform X1 [Ruditapes philippinarum]